MMRLGMVWIVVVLVLTGCAAPSWVGGKGDEKSTKFQVPDPGTPTGLRLVWKRSVAGSPDKHFFHPGRIAVIEDAVFVGTYQGRVVRLDRRSGEVMWEYKAGSSVMGGVAVDEERVCFGTEQGEVIALSRTTGKEVWRIQVATAVDSAPVIADGKVMLLTLDNRTYALDAATGQKIWVHATPAESLVVMGSAAPTAQDGLVFVGYSSGEVFALNTTNGKRAWSDNLRVLGGSGELDLMQDVDASIVLSEQQGPQVTPRRAFVVNHQGRVVAFFAATGTRIWEKRASALRQPLWSNGRLFLSDMEGNLLAMSGEDGVELWRVRLTDGVLTTSILYKDQLLVADNQGRLFALDPSSGRILGMERISGSVMSLPVATENGLFYWTNEGDLLRYE